MRDSQRQKLYDAERRAAERCFSLDRCLTGPQPTNVDRAQASLNACQEYIDRITRRRPA